MPYEWSSVSGTSDNARHLRLWPHRSLPRRGFAAFVLATFGLITIPLYPLLGTIVLWGILPFLLASVGAIWWALERSYRDANLLEDLTIDPEEIHLIRTEPNGHIREWDCQSYWARAQIHISGGPVPHYITLSGKGREVEIGAFLSEDERKTLYAELSDALRQIGRGQGVV